MSSSSPPSPVPSRPWQSAVLFGAAITVLAVAVWLLFLGGGKGKPPDNPAPAKTATVKEGELNVIKLTRKAEERLGLKTGELRRENRRQYRTVGGEIIAIPGRDVLVTAPIAGRLQVPPNWEPRAGAKVTLNQSIFYLVPLLTPEARTTLITAQVEVQGTLKSAQTEKEAAQIALKRAETVLRDGGGSRRAVDDAQARFDLGSRAVEAAEARLKLLKDLLADVDKGALTPVPIPSPAEGVLRTVTARAGQLVATGAALFEVANLDQVWLRVPLYAGDLASVDDREEVQFDRLGAVITRQSPKAAPLPEPPPTASALASSVDLFYTASNAGWRPGQRVSVQMPLRLEKSVPVVPWSAIQLDVNGSAWIYENPQPRVYQRRRVRVRYVDGNDAVLETGLPANTKIAVSGVAELFGAEVGLGQKAGAKFVDDE